MSRTTLREQIRFRGLRESPLSIGTGNQRAVMHSFVGEISACVIEKARAVAHGLCVVAAVVMGLGIESHAQDYLLTAVENGGAGRSKIVAVGGVDLP